MSTQELQVRDNLCFLLRYLVPCVLPVYYNYLIDLFHLLVLISFVCVVGDNKSYEKISQNSSTYCFR